MTMTIRTELELRKQGLLAALELKIVDTERAELESNPPPLAQLRARAEELRRELQDTPGLDGRQAMLALAGKGAGEDPPWGEKPKPNLRDLEILVAELAKEPSMRPRQLGTCLRVLADDVDPPSESQPCDSPGCRRLTVPGGGRIDDLTLCPEHEREHEQRARAEEQKDIAHRMNGEGDNSEDGDDEEDDDEGDDVQAAKPNPTPTRDKPGSLAERVLADPQTSVDWRAVGVREAKAERARRPNLSRMSFNDQVDVIVGTVLTNRWGALPVPAEPAAAIREGVRAELAGDAKLTNAVLEGAEVPAKEEDRWRVGTKGSAPPRDAAEVEHRINRVLAKGPKSRLQLAQEVGFWDGSAPLFGRVMKKMGRSNAIFTREGAWHLTPKAPAKAADKTPAAARP